jgi:hypothetical protein
MQRAARAQRAQRARAARTLIVRARPSRGKTATPPLTWGALLGAGGQQPGAPPLQELLRAPAHGCAAGSRPRRSQALGHTPIKASRRFLVPRQVAIGRDRGPGFGQITAQPAVLPVFTPNCEATWTCLN